MWQWLLVAILGHGAGRADGARPAEHNSGLLRREGDLPDERANSHTPVPCSKEEDVRPGHAPCPGALVVLETDLQPKKTSAFGSPTVDDFKEGQRVTWTGEDVMVPRGTVGRVAQVYRQSHYVEVDFPGGRWKFNPKYLRPVAEKQKAPITVLTRAVTPESGASSYTNVYPGTPSNAQEKSMQQPLLSNEDQRPGPEAGLEAANRTLPANTSLPANKSDSLGNAVPVPVLGALNQPSLPEDPESHERSVKRCLMGLAVVLLAAVLAALAGYLYLCKVLPSVTPDSESGQQEGEAARGPAAEGGDGATVASPTPTPSAGAVPLLAEGKEESTDHRLPDRIRYSYCLPTVSTLPVGAVISVFVLAFYSQRGASLPVIAMAVAIARSFDVVSDPIMSYLTDSCRHPAGRRRPFMIVGAPVFAVFLVALFNPPFLTPQLLACWFSVAYILFFLVNTFTNIPYDAWGPELTEDSDERARLFFLSGLFDGGGTLFAFGLPFAGYWLSERTGVTSGICLDKQDLVQRCASGFHCVDYNANGKGYEFVMNTSFGHSALGIFTSELAGYDCDLAEPDIFAGTQLEETAIATFCDCMRTCAQACASSNRAWGYMLTGAFFGAWYLCTAYNCCHTVSERKPPPGGRPPSRPLVPSMLGTLQNPAFAALLPAWACDAVSAAVFQALCPYLVMYVLAPEFQTPEDSPFNIDCKNGARGVSTSDSYDRRCSTQNVLGACVGAALLAAMATTPIWLWGVKKYGKVRMWLLWSLTMAATNYLFVFLGKSWIRIAIAVCMLNGIPIAAKFLADAILADIIDYDEFLTGCRSEATYTMFKSFLPKVMAIPAAALPLSVLNTAGHRPAVNGRIMQQPSEVRWAITIMVGVVSGTISMIAWAIKTKYPLNSNEIIEEMGRGIALHKEGKPATDPLSGIEYEVVHFTQEENVAGVWSLDHFPGLQVVERMRDDPVQGLQAVVSGSNRDFFLSIGVLVLVTTGLGGSLKLLEHRTLSFVPTIMAVAMGCSFVFLGLNFSRRQAALAMKASPPSPELVFKVLKQRQARLALDVARKVRRSGAKVQGGKGGFDPAEPSSPKSSSTQ